MPAKSTLSRERHFALFHWLFFGFGVSTPPVRCTTRIHKYMHTRLKSVSESMGSHDEVVGTSRS